MSKLPTRDSAPTMIIPSGTEIEVDPHGQLSIRAPGNLVIQNSGSYGTIESRGGSIRIERNVEVEAVTVRCADACYVQGSLTAWKVAAQSLQLEEQGRAHIVLQETDRLVVGSDARLVGNFASEKELFFLFSRFAEQVRSLPFFAERRGTAAAPEAGRVPSPRLASDRGGAAGPVVGMVGPGEAGDGQAPSAEERPTAHERPELPEALFFSLVLLERDAARKSYGPTSQRVVEEVIKLLQERDLETLRHTYRTLFRRILEPAADARRAGELIAGHFGADADGEEGPRLGEESPQ